MFTSQELIRERPRAVLHGILGTKRQEPMRETLSSDNEGAS
jgi:hypothetical protein